MRYVLKLTTAKVRLMTLAIVALAAAGAYFASLWPVVLADIYNGLSSGALTSLGSVATPAAQFAACLVLAELLGIARRVSTDVAAADLEASARSHSLESTLALPVSRVGGSLSAELATLANQGVEGCCQVFKLACNDLVPSVATVAFVAYQVVCGAPPVILACMLGYVATTATLSFFQIRSQNGIRDGINVKQSSLAGNVAQSLANHEGIRTMAAEAHEARRLAGRIRDIAKLEKYHHRAMGGFDSAKQAGKAAFFTGILLTGVQLVSAGRMDGGMVVAAMMLFNQLTVPLDSVYRLLDEFASSNVKIGRLAEMDAEAQAERDARTAQARASRAQEARDRAVGHAAAPCTDGAEADEAARPAGIAPSAADAAFARPAAVIEARDVTVLAPDGHAINSGLAFRIPAGSTFCLDGGNGCGKSSLMKALLGYFPHTGSIRVMGRALESYEPAELARTACYLPQRPFLFSGTIADNVAYGLDRRPTDQEMRTALDKALVRLGRVRRRSAGVRSERRRRQPFRRSTAAHRGGAALPAPAGGALLGRSHRLHRLGFGAEAHGKHQGAHGENRRQRGAHYTPERDQRAVRRLFEPGPRALGRRFARWRRVRGNRGRRRGGRIDGRRGVESGDGARWHGRDGGRFAIPRSALSPPRVHRRLARHRRKEPHMLRRNARTRYAARWSDDAGERALHLPYSRRADNAPHQALAGKGRPMSWYHSGLEGLCAALAGDFDNAPKVQFARDLFNDDDTLDKGYNATRVWTLSRTGRVGKFEEAWTGRDLPAKKRNQMTAKRALERFAGTFSKEGSCAELRYALVHGYGDGLTAAERLHVTVLRAMAAGFAAERYGTSAITAFSGDMDALARAWDPVDDATTKEIAKRLVAAAVYGPDCPLALSDETAKTAEGAPSERELLFARASTSSVVVTHLYDGVAAKVGACNRYGDDRAVLIGRSSRPERYRARIDQLGIASVARLLDEHAAEILRIPELHERVSSCHGVLACEEGAWYYYDLDSTNGTLVDGGDGSFAVEGMCEVRPGDVLFLGVRDEREPDDVLFWDAAALLVSMSVDPGCLR